MQYDTVLSRIRRIAKTANIGLEQVGGKLKAGSRKIMTNELKEFCSTTRPQVFAIGDCSEVRKQN
jgi:pyruvate/2-oxoglutarate dehydrogenase complex dihydrolipoamide dehydrogenase (E3) component